MVGSFLLASVGCGADPLDQSDAGGGGADAALDLGRAHWVHAPVYSDSATFASSSNLVITASGELIAAWVEDVGDNEIFVAEGGPAFSARSIMSLPGENFSAPSLSAGESAVHLVAAAVAGSTNSDIFYARREGAEWSAKVNLTGPSDVNSFVDFNPVVLEVGTDIVVLYLSRVPSTINDGLYMIRFTDPGQAGPATTLLDRATFDCSDVEAVTDASDAIHIITNCAEDGGDREIIYLTNKSGTFVSRSITTPAATFALSPDIAVSAGGAVHLLWNASTDCGGLVCRDVFYSRDLGTPVSITGGDEDGGFFPHVAVDSLGRVIVVFHRGGTVDDVMWTYSESGTSFVRVQQATPGTPASIDSTVGSLVIHPLTDRPHMVYGHSLIGPAGANIFHGELIR